MADGASLSLSDLLRSFTPDATATAPRLRPVPREQTPIPAYLEPAFRAWVQKNNITDLDDPESKYDYRGAFLEGVGTQINSVDNRLHWPGTFKQHGHPSFSEESQYSRGSGDGGTWDGERFQPSMRRDQGAANPDAMKRTSLLDLIASLTPRQP